MPVDISDGLPSCNRVRLAVAGPAGITTGTVEVVYDCAPGGVSDLYFSEATLTDCSPALPVAVSDAESPGDIGRQEIDVLPNPSQGIVELRAQVTGPAAPILIYDVAGRRVRTLDSSQVRPGWVQVIWNGKDDVGRRVPAGTYFAVLSGSSPGTATRLVLVR